MESLPRGKDVFCVLPIGFGKSLFYQMFVQGKSFQVACNACVKRGESVGNSRLLPHAKMLLVPMKYFLCRADYALEENVLTEQM